MNIRHILATALAGGLLAVGASAQNNPNGNNPPPERYRRVYDRDHRHYRCERYRHDTARRDTVIGAVGGGILGGAIGGHAGGVLLGAGAGALAGNAVGRSQVHC
jgi:predicted lipid-binding transport protein (Tim44 family)